MRLGWILAILLLAAPFAGIGAADTTSPEPHVIVAIPDSGINPYHEDFYRPDLTDHPCTYVEGFPCSVQKLDLSIDYANQAGVTYDEALAADASVWEDVEAGTVYWIPKTSFVAVMCTGFEGSAVQGSSETCILDDGTDHGTGTTSSVVRENPDALIAFKQGSSSLEPLQRTGVPIDIWSVSWGTLVPIPLRHDVPDRPIYVKAAGNDPRPVASDGWSGNPELISVGGAYPERGIVADYESEPQAAKQADVVSWYCRDVAPAQATGGSRTACGTSFAAPTVAGALSKVILDVREATGYTGTITKTGLVNPDNGVTTHDVREGMNRTATYEPTYRPSDQAFVAGPRVDQAPWVQWGWGFYDHRTADATTAHLLESPAPEKPLGAQLYMGLSHALRTTLY